MQQVPTKRRHTYIPDYMESHGTGRSSSEHEPSPSCRNSTTATMQSGLTAKRDIGGYHGGDSKDMAFWDAEAV
jgi:hypothetical protein